jgi:hypothetical protein
MATSALNAPFDVGLSRNSRFGKGFRNRFVGFYVMVSVRDELVPPLLQPTSLVFPPGV